MDYSLRYRVAREIVVQESEEERVKEKLGEDVQELTERYQVRTARGEA